LAQVLRNQVSVTVLPWQRHNAGVRFQFQRTWEAQMGFLDVLNGMANGPRGHTDPNSKGGMSPITMAILALLAYKGIKHLTNQSPAPSGAPQPRLPGNASAPGGGGLGDVLGGMLNGPRGGGSQTNGPDLGDLLKGGLGGLLAGGAAGGILSGGLGSLVDQLQRNGQGDAARSWVGKGANQDISESDLAKSIGSDDIDALTRHTGLSRDELLSGLRRELPGAVDEMTPDGHVPDGDELQSRWA
jgi:uncharacterized protein YidB (DUF937 family)